MERSAPSRGLPSDAKSVVHHLRARPSFLMVGTIEPRKGHLEVLETFQRLWCDGVDVNLVVVGHEGWRSEPQDQRRNIPQTVACLKAHPELNHRLFWLDGISDEYLEQVYAACTCLVFASYGEGFGLPLVEAAQRKLPIIARDIPVFREVAGEHALYFDGTEGRDLAGVVTRWLRLWRDGQHPRSEHLRRLTWRESAASLLRALDLPGPS